MAKDKKLPLQSSNNANVAATATSAKTIEETYQKKTQLEHILLRPDTYVGSIEKHTQTLWVYENNEMVHRSISYVPGLYKIFDEILVNAADNKQRDPSMDSLKVTIDVEQNCISVYNNGDGVPVEIHQEEGVYVPEMIFGHLLTSSNYDDSMKKTTGGRNGYGAKLTNIFSTEFVIETADGKRQKKYKQVFSNNMGKKSEPAITKCKESENWTKVTFKPDLAKFNMTHLEDDVVALMKKRVIDLAGCLGKTVKVELNGQRIPVKSFLDYVNLYLQSASKARPDALPRIVEKVNDRWEICVSLTEGQFQQVSFVNSIATIKGGTHVDYVTNQITNYVMGIVNKKNKNANLKAHAVKNHLWVFVNALIDNPAFDSQTKETLTIRQSSFGSKCELSQEFLKKVSKSGIVESLLSWADFKQSKDLKKTDGTKRQRITGITKLEDANDAGGKSSDKCTLILTEGDSAKALAMAGISVVGRNYYGVFPLRGKLLNVREASHKQIMENAEIQSIKQILGLQHGKQYDSVKTLRYGHLMIMTDQLLGWMHRKFRTNEPLKDFSVGNSCTCLSGKPSLDDQQYYPKSNFGTKSLGKAQRDNHLQKSFSSLEAARVEADDFEEESSVAISELFHGFLTIGTLGSDPVITDASTPTFATSVENITEKETEVTENELKLINDELEKVIGAEGDGCNDSSGRNSHVSTGRNSYVSTGRSSHGSTITLSGKPLEGTETNGNGTTICPLQGYLFGSAIELPETTTVVKKERRTSLGELFQRKKIAEENYVAKSERGEKRTEKETDKSAILLMKKMLKKRMVHGSSRSCTTSTGGNVDSASSETKLHKESPS